MSNRVKLSENFYLDEFVPKKIYYQKGIKPEWFVRPNMVKSAQLFRSIVDKPVIINNWWDGGEFQYSGYRDPACKEGSTLSQHRAFNAEDLKCGGMTGADMFEVVKFHFKEFNKLGITTVENPASTPTWLHLDGRFLNLSFEQEELYIVNP